VKSLNDIMEFDLVVRVHPDGSVTRAEGIYAPEVYPDYAEKGHDHISGYPFGYDYETGKPKRGAEWSLMRGYTGQHGCADSAHMHNSEFIGGRMERDILANPGLYVAVTLDWPCDTYYGCDGPDPETGESCDMDHVEGWAVAYLLDSDE
jgi:hypothetical protein